MLTLILIVKLVCEIALLSFLGRAMLAMLAGEKRQSNPFYAIFCMLTQPFVRAAGWVTPSFVLTKHHPFVAFCVLCVLWILVTLFKIKQCLQVGLEHCR